MKNVTLIVRDITRFSRNLIEAMKIFERFEKQNITLASANDYINTATATGRHILRVYISDAQKESDTISERAIKAAEFRKKHNIPIGQIPYGYTTKMVNDNKKVVDEYKMCETNKNWKASNK